MAKKVITGDEGNMVLQKRIAELKEANTRLDGSNAVMHLTVSRSSEAVSTLRRELDVELENYELLRLGNTHLLNERNEARSQVTDLEPKLAEMKASAAKDTATLEAKFAQMETHIAENSNATEKRLEDFCVKLSGDLAPLREAYERNIQNLGGICSHVPGVNLLAEDYIHLLKSEVDYFAASLCERQ
jgi:chromosome segregation ATPase